MLTAPSYHERGNSVEGLGRPRLPLGERLKTLVNRFDQAIGRALLQTSLRDDAGLGGHRANRHAGLGIVELESLGRDQGRPERYGRVVDPVNRFAGFDKAVDQDRQPLEIQRLRCAKAPLLAQLHILQHAVGVPQHFITAIRINVAPVAVGRSEITADLIGVQSDLNRIDPAISGLKIFIGWGDKRGQQNAPTM